MMRTITRQLLRVNRSSLITSTAQCSSSSTGEVQDINQIHLLGRILRIKRDRVIKRDGNTYRSTNITTRIGSGYEIHNVNVKEEDLEGLKLSENDIVELKGKVCYFHDSSVTDRNKRFTIINTESIKLIKKAAENNVEERVKEPEASNN